MLPVTIKIKEQGQGREKKMRTRANNTKIRRILELEEKGRTLREKSRSLQENLDKVRSEWVTLKKEVENTVEWKLSLKSRGRRDYYHFNEIVPLKENPLDTLRRRRQPALLTRSFRS
jgi:hypothetical protein